MPLDFTAIDFETANSHRRSACAIGLTKIRNGDVTDRLVSYIRPPDDVPDFTNTWVHRITAHDVRDAPRWDALLPTVLDFVGDDYLVAHNASFDSSVFVRTTEAYGSRAEGLRFMCTLRAARAMLSLGSYSLPFVARELGISEFDHHDARADSDAAARVAVALAARAGASTITELIAALPAGPARDRNAPAASAAEWANLAQADALVGETVCFTGGLRTMTRAVAQGFVRSLGGDVAESATKKTTLVVTGDFEARTFAPGATMSSKLAKAFSMAEAGIPVRIVTEDEFLQMVDVTADQVTG